MAWFRNRIRHVLGGEDGFSIIELIAALSILLVGILGVAATLSKSRDVVTTAEVREIAVHRAERELERLRSVAYDNLAITHVPADSADPTDPAFYIEGTQYQWDPANAASVAPLVVAAGGTEPLQQWTDTRVGTSDVRVSGTVQVYVTNFVDSVPGVAQAKRVIVGVTVNGRYRLPRPTVLSTVVHRPPVPTP